jgi:hypothetical protein
MEGHNHSIQPAETSQNSNSEQCPEDRQNKFLGEMNQLQKFQEDLWSKGTV